MNKVKIGIIGGTGLDNKPDLIENRKESIISTNYGSVEILEGLFIIFYKVFPLIFHFLGKISGVECVRKK